MFLRKLFFISILSIFSLTVFGYGVYKALPLILGPKVILSSPQNGDIAVGTTVNIHGSVTRTKTLYVNNIPTAFTENGSFATMIPVYPGNNILTIEAFDRFGRSVLLTRNIGSN